MQIVSFYFFLFLILTTFIYYLVPKNKRWFVLLVSSLFFFYKASSSLFMIVYLMIGVISTYIGSILINKYNNNTKKKKIIYIITLLTIISELFLFKYINIFPLTANAFGRLFSINIGFKYLSIIAPLGISYYTLSLISYVTDVYLEACVAQKNFFKHTLFSCYYPVMISGPVIKYNKIKDTLFDGNKFEWDNIYHGFTRVIYGLMKKLIIANQLSNIVKIIFADYHAFSGYFIIIGTFFYAIQIYADFSGCMDIVIGSSKLYGVILPENFNSPFFSKNLSEFWRRWHISLGEWGKEYIMYPLLKSSTFQNLGKITKKKFGKKYGKMIPTVLSIFILWLIIGLWHGASFRYIFAAGILPWIYLTTGQFFGEYPKNLVKKLNIKTDCFSYRLFESFRTLAFMCFIWLFACSPSLLDSLDVIKSIFVLPTKGLSDILNLLPVNIILLTSALVIIVDYMNYKEINVYEWFKKQNLCFRWFILLLMIGLTLVYGVYGPGYNAADFIYGGF